MTDLPFSFLDRETPGGVYLCQIRPGVSCGACCGLYNVSDASRPAVFDMLKKRTDLFASVERTYEGVLAFSQELEKTENQNRPIDDFHHCPYLGFMDTDPFSPGCLLHPMAKGNKGLDLRGISHYGGMTCNMYFCPSCREVPERYKKILRHAADDWHSFGLIITEAEVINCFFGIVEKDSGTELDPDKADGNKGLLDAIRSFINLKTDWPFRKNGILANYFFNDREIIDPLKDEKTLETRWNPVLRAFRSEFKDTDELYRAVGLLEETALKVVKLIS